MTQIKYTDTFLSRSEHAAREASIKADRNFMLTLARAARNGTENASFGVAVDSSPMPFATRIRPDRMTSIAGSPADMCLAAAINPVGRRAVK